MAPVLMALLLGSASSWAVDGFQDAKWGMSPDEVRAVLPPKACRQKLTSVGGFAQLLCVQSVGGVERANVHYGFKDDHLLQIYADAGVDDNKGVPIAKNILAGLTTKYGPPSSGWNENQQSVCAAATWFSITGIVATWDKEGVDVLALDESTGWSLVHICYVDVAGATKEAEDKAKAEAAALKEAADKAAGGL